MAAATAIRKKEAAAFAKFKEESDTNLAALAKAFSAIGSGMARSFLPTTAASASRLLAIGKADKPDETRQELLSFLSGKDSDDYAPKSGQIVGILKEMDDDMTKSLAEAAASEEAAVKTRGPRSSKDQSRCSDCAD